MSTLATAAPAAPLPPATRRSRDFPTWLPAMLVKELRQGLRARGFVGAFVGFQIVMALIGVFAVAGGVGSNAFTVLQIGYWVMLGAQLLVVTPVRALVGLQSELEARSVDLLLLTRLTAWRIVAGKWISLLAQAALLVIALLPYGVVRYFFGSVDLAKELGALSQMFAGCAVLTAAALWASALPRLARLGFGLALFFVWQASPASLEALFRSVSSPGYRTYSSGTFGISASANLPVFFAGALVLVVCLIGAVRRLAPPADNPSALLRAVPLVALLPAPFFDLRSATAQCAVAGLLAVFIAMLELARAEEPLPMHWQAWSRRGWWGRIVGRFVQPGWASAFEWLLLLAVVGMGLGFASPWPEKVGRPVLLAVTALAFPTLLLSFVGSRHAHRTAAYGLILGAGSLIAAVAAGTSTAMHRGSFADAILHVLPISGFWMSMNARQTPTYVVMLVQISVAASVLGATWWRSRAYHQQRRQFAAPIRNVAPDA